MRGICKLTIMEKLFQTDVEEMSFDWLLASIIIKSDKIKYEPK